MPRQPSYLTEHVTIAKSDIAKCSALACKANLHPVDVGGTLYESKRLRFATFAGARSADGMYRGVYRYEAGDWKECDAADFAELPRHTATVNQQKRKKPLEETEAT